MCGNLFFISMICFVRIQEYLQTDQFYMFSKCLAAFPDSIDVDIHTVCVNIDRLNINAL